MKKQFALLISLMLFEVGAIYAQDLTAIGATTKQYTAEHPIEKAYLQLDKPYYAAGDTIYFKGYVTIGPEHKLSALSGVLHAELIGPGGKLVRREQLQMVAGTAWGDFALADSLKAGTYRLRAYTNWTRNEGEDSFFEQAIAVGRISHEKQPGSGAPKGTIARHNGKYNQPDVQFLPEGGSLVAGVPARVAVKCVDTAGLGQNITGKIEDDAGNVVAELTTRHLGMGVFALIPQSGKSYKARINIPGDESFTVPLPGVQAEGFTLSVNNSRQDSVFIKIATNEKTLAANKNKPFYFIAQSGGKVCYTAGANLGMTSYTAGFAKSSFPTGIVRFTLFSSAGEPLNERLAFIDNNSRLKLELKTEKATYNSREQVKLTLNTKDKQDKAVPGSFSVSVTDETKVPADTIDENNILSNLLLTSELKGTVEQPAYYFSKKDEKTAADLDNLLLTQGYRYFAWKRVLDKEQASMQYPAENKLTISGIVKKGGKPFPGAKVTLFSKEDGPFKQDTLSDGNGHFAFKELLFTDGTHLLVQAKVKKGQENVTLELDTIGSPPSMKTKVGEVQTDLSVYMENARLFNQELQKYDINKHALALKEVKIKAKKEPSIPHSQNLNGPGNADFVFGPRELEKMICGRIVDCLQGVIPGVTFDLNGYPLNNRVIDFIAPSATPRDLSDKQTSPAEHRMAIMIDGHYVGAEEFRDLRPDDIEGIEVIKSLKYGVIYGSRMAKGGLIVTTKRAHKPIYTNEEEPGVTTFIFSGFYKAREFYSPQYDNLKTNQRMADLRTTIYWQPDVVTDKDGRASFTYFNADGKGTYRVVVEGIDADGNLGRQVYRYEVK